MKKNSYLKYIIGAVFVLTIISAGFYFYKKNMIIDGDLSADNKIKSRYAEESFRFHVK